MTTDEIKALLAQPGNYNCPLKDIKRGSKSKNHRGEITRVFTIRQDTGDVQVEVITDPEDETIICFQPHVASVVEPELIDNRRVARRELALVVRDLQGNIINTTTGLDEEYPNEAQDEYDCLVEEEGWISTLVIDWLYPERELEEYYIERGDFNEASQYVENMLILQNNQPVAKITLERVG